MKELIERLRLQAQVKSDAYSVPKEDTFDWDVANALEQQASRIAELEAELAKYHNAPVVAWHHPEEGLSYENHFVGNIPLIIKPEES